VIINSVFIARPTVSSDIRGFIFLSKPCCSKPRGYF